MPPHLVLAERGVVRVEGVDEHQGLADAVDHCWA